MKFPYVYWRGRYCPLVEVELIHQDKSIRALAYADTGATYSVFHSEYCEELGMDLTSGKRVDITVGDGGIIPVYIYQLKVKIGDLEAVSKIGFSDRLGIGIPILGREDILDKYLICFDGKNKEVIWHK